MDSDRPHSPMSLDLGWEQSDIDEVYYTGPCGPCGTLYCYVAEEEDEQCSSWWSWTILLFEDEEDCPIAEGREGTPEGAKLAVERQVSEYRDDPMKFVRLFTDRIGT